MSEGRRAALAILALVVAVAITFAGSLDNEFVNWDDGNYIVINPLVTDPGSFGVWERLTTPSIGYAVPLPMLIYATAWSVTQEPWLFHLISLVVHAFNAALLAWLLWKETRRLRVSWIGAAAFALHPMVVEPVAWATGLKDLLVGTGCLLAIAGLRRGPPAVAGALVAFGSKPSGGLLGIALAAFCWRDDERESLRRPAVLGAVVTVVLLGLGAIAFAATQETEQLRTSAEGGPTMARVFGAIGLHLEHVFVPAALSPRYPLEAITGLHIGLGIVVTVALGWLGVRWVRARDHRLGWLVLGVVTYLPASNLRPLIRFTADSYMYVPWLAATACGAMSYVVHEDRLIALGQRSFGALRALVILALPGWAVLSSLEVETWADTRSLWELAAERYPEDGELVYRYGDALGRAGEREQELALYLSNLTALEGSPMIPAGLMSWYAFRDQLDEADHWYALAFASAKRQDDAVYWGYVEYVANHPERHRAEHDAALAHALGVYADRLGESRLDGPRLEWLVTQARRLRRPDVARRLGEHRGAVLGSP